MDYRLPRTVLPRHYRIHLRPDFEKARFSGSEQVELQVTTETSEIVCNAAELDISSAQLRPLLDVDGNSPGPAGDVRTESSVRLDAERQRAHFTFVRPIPPGMYELEVEFSGAFDDKLRGFFLNTFVDSDGREQSIANTQFQSTDARRAFPCWDEPDMKAVFAVELDVPPGMIAISNGPETSAMPLDNGWQRVAFGETPVMSSYIVAFVIGQLETSQAVVVDGIPIRVVHVPGKAHLARYALQVAAHALSFYQEWFGLPYPGEKLDLVAVPNRGGAMENLGAAIFLESALLVDPDEVSRQEIERVTEVIEHEIAHMWFGDLVTMSWWNGLWLNEAFATFMSLKCLDSFRPEWECWTNFGRDRETAMLMDALSTTRPIEFTVREPDEAEAMYDSLTYQKGASVVRMIEQYLGEDRFQAGVRRYLKLHQFGNTETSDLWQAIEASVEGEPVAEIMSSWIFQRGYPVLTVSAAAAGDGLQLQQEHFGPADSRDGSRSWLVPCLLRRLLPREADQLAERSKVLLSSGSEAQLLAGDQQEVVVNAGASGFFRVRYEPRLRAPLLKNLASLEPLEQYNLVSDSWALALFGLAPLAEFIEVASLISPPVDDGVYRVIDEALRTFDHAVTPSARPKLQAWTRSLLQPALDRVGWLPQEGESARCSELRSVAIRELGDIGEDPAVIEQARHLFAEDREGRSRLHPATAAAVMSVVAGHATGGELMALDSRFREARDPQGEERLLEALSFCRDQAFISELCTNRLSQMKNPHVGILLRRLMMNRHSGQPVWEFFKSNWGELFERHAGKGLWRMLSGTSWLVLPGSDGRSLEKDVQAFFTPQALGGMRRTIDEALDALGIRASFVARDGPVLGQVLESVGGTASPAS
ncbi:MAG: M1 family metallopeptidase [Acidimicrobiales bacterium]